MHVLSTPPAFVLSQDQTLRECFPAIGATHHESGTARRNKPGRSQRPRCVFLQRNLAPTGHPAGDGVSTYLALTFGTLLSSQGTDASFVLTRETLSRLSSGRFPSVLRFRLYQTVSGPIPSRWDSRRRSEIRFSRFPFRRLRLYQKFWAGRTGIHFLNHREGFFEVQTSRSGRYTFQLRPPGLSGSSAQPCKPTSLAALCQQDLPGRRTG